MRVSEPASHEPWGGVRGPFRFRTICHHTLAANALADLRTWNERPPSAVLRQDLA